MRARAARTRREPLGESRGRRLYRLLRSSGHEIQLTALTVHRPSDISTGANQAWQMVLTNHESRITAFMVFTKHETRDTKHGFWVLKPFSLFLLPRPAWHEDSEAVIPGCISRRVARRSLGESWLDEVRASCDSNTAFEVFCESRNTNHALYVRSVRRCCARVAPPGTAGRAAEPSAESMLYCPLLPIFCCKLLHTSAHGGGGMCKGPGAVNRSRHASSRAPFAGKSCKMREAQSPPRLPSPPGLDPLRRPQNEPMPGSH